MTVYTIHHNHVNQEDRQWLSLLRDLDCEHAFTGLEFTTLELAKKHAEQITEVTGVEKLMIIEDYDIAEDVDNPDYSPVIHYLGDNNEQQ